MVEGRNARDQIASYVFDSFLCMEVQNESWLRMSRAWRLYMAKIWRMETLHSQDLIPTRKEQRHIRRFAAYRKIDWRSIAVVGNFHVYL